MTQPDLIIVASNHRVSMLAWYGARVPSVPFLPSRSGCVVVPTFEIVSRMFEQLLTELARSSAAGRSWYQYLETSMGNKTLPRDGAPAF